MEIHNNLKSSVNQMGRTKETLPLDTQHRSCYPMSREAKMYSGLKGHSISLSICINLKIEHNSMKV